MVVAVEGAAVATCGVVLAALAWRTAGVTELVGALWTVAAAAAGVCAADLGSGLAHWAGDTFLTEDAPLVGRRVIGPFREHHRDPLAITRHGFVERTGNTAVILIPLAGVVWWHGTPATAGAVLVHVAFVAFALAIAVTNEIHAFAHAARVPRTVRWLQRAGLILDPAAHDRHHRGGFTRAYCITTGWLNGPLDRFAVWARLERSIRALGTLGRRRTRGCAPDVAWVRRGSSALASRGRPGSAA
jgi:ubiquitin-conjugating enzyme E2 variant